MPRIFVAPADTAPDKACLERSIINPVDRQAIIKTFSDATYPELIDIERRGRGFYAWGFPSEAEYVEKWFHMGIGDFVLMTFDGAYRYYGKVLGRYDNTRAANAIWGESSDGETARELLFFLSEPIALTLPTNELQDYFPQSRPTNFKTIFRRPKNALVRFQLMSWNASRAISAVWSDFFVIACSI